MSIFLKQSKFKNGRVFLSIVNGYYDPVSKNSKQKTIEKIGFLDNLEKQYDDPITFFRNKVKVMNQEKTQSQIITKSIDLNEELSTNDHKYNLGYIFLKYLYNELGLNKFFMEKQKKLNVNYNLNQIFSLLVFSRIMFPGSKKNTFDNRNIYFEQYNKFELHDIYRSLDIFVDYKEELELLLWNATKDKYNRDVSRTYYDCTNYYFEINYNDDDLVDEEGNVIEKGYRKRGPEKNHRPDPIVELGLLMDATDIPLAYDIFPGNESEKLSLRPLLKKTKSKFEIKRTVVVADRGLNTSDNIFFLAGQNKTNNKDGYIYGQSVRGASQEFKDWVLNQDGYIDDPIYDKDGKPVMFRSMKFDKDGHSIGYEKKQAYFRHKSRIFPKEITIEKDGKRKVKVRTDQKQMVYYSKKYADKQKHDRNQMIERAKDIIRNPKKYDKVSCKGAKNYINNIKFVKSTGDIADGLDLSLKEDLIKEEEKFDGYYSIVTSELKMSDMELRDKYRGLAKIEETFKITKTELETRPIYVWTKEHIEAHFLTCFIALVIIRLLEKKTNHNYSIRRLINSMNNFSAELDIENIYKLSGANDVIMELIKQYNLENDLKKYMTREKIKKILKYWKIYKLHKVQKTRFPL